MTMLLLGCLRSSSTGGGGPMLWRYGIGGSVSSTTHGTGSHLQLLTQLRVRVVVVTALMMTMLLLLLLVQVSSNRGHGDGIGDGSGNCVCQSGCNVVHYVHDRSTTTTSGRHRTGCFIRRDRWRRRRGR